MEGKGDIPKVAERVRFVGTVIRPSSTAIPRPRQYFDIGRSISQREAKLFEIRLQAACKHISSVITCNQSPKGDRASFYVSYGGLDPTPGCKDTQRRLKKYSNDVRRIIASLVAVEPAA